MLLTWSRYGKPDISMTINGILAGLVAITAGCDAVTPIGAFFIGLVAAFTMVYAVEFIDHKLKIDDPVGAVAVHGVCGALGTILTGAFSQSSGFLYTGRFNFFLVQCLGVISVAVWVTVTACLLFIILKHTVGIRVSEEDETRGLDYSIHGLIGSYADFIKPSTGASQFYPSAPLSGMPAPAVVLDASGGGDDDIPYDLMKADGKIRNVVVLMNPNRFSALMTALDAINITGMTVTNVNGCGIQKGHAEFYRGATYDTQLLPKLKVEIVISTVPVGLLIKTIRDTLYTGKIGDGKIFIYELENVIKVRTGNSGKAALV
jgi:Amt family ammonium transporter